MRRIAYILVGLALVGAATWYCSSDSPAAPKPGSGGGGPTSPSALQIRLFTSNPNPVAGACTVIQAVVTLNGANVPDGTGVSFSTDLATSFFSQNGLPLISVVTQGGTTTTALCSTATGLATVRANATVGSQTGSATIAIAFQPSTQAGPFFTFCSPSFGPSSGGTTLTINGGRFSGSPTTTRATFTAAGITREALVTSVTATAVTVVTPAFPEATTPSVPVNIALTFGTNTAAPVTLSVPNCFAFGTATAGTPIITAVLPSSGSNEGNTQVTIIGSGFVTPLQVFFGPVEAQVLSVGFNQIIVLTPPASGAGLPNLNQSVTVRVHEVTSGVDATLPNAFRFVTAIQITAMDNTRQPVDQPFTAVTVHGQGFLSPVAVSLAGVPAKVISVSATELLVLPGTPFISSCTDLSGPVIVTNIDSGDTTTGPAFIYEVALTKPIIASVSPSSGPPGTTVTITGSHLGNITNVTFDTRSAIIVSVSPTQVVVTAPGIDDPAVCGTATGKTVDVKVKSDVTQCEATATGAFQYPCVPPTPPATPTPVPTATPPPTATPTPAGTADLALTKSGSPSAVVSGSNLAYRLFVQNNGPATATGVSLSDPLPFGTTFTACTTTQGSCTGPAVGSNGTITASLGNIPSPGFAVVTVVVTVTAPGGITLTNTAVVTSTTTDPNLANNVSSVTTTVNLPPAGADLSAVKTSLPDPVATGGNLTYTVTVHNGGPADGTGTILNDPIPSGTTFVSCVSTLGTCTGPAVGTNGTVTANLGTLASGSTATVTIVVNVTAPAGTTLTNTAVVTSAVTDPNPANNSGTTSTTVGP
jgi:uncharacterized repeat protein (TIGR01451 family)